MARYKMSVNYYSKFITFELKKDIKNVVYDLLAHFQNSLAVYHLIPIHFSK